MLSMRGGPAAGWEGVQAAANVANSVMSSQDR